MSAAFETWRRMCISINACELLQCGYPMLTCNCGHNQFHSIAREGCPTVLGKFESYIVCMAPMEQIILKICCAPWLLAELAQLLPVTSDHILFAVFCCFSVKFNPDTMLPTYACLLTQFVSRESSKQGNLSQHQLALIITDNAIGRNWKAGQLWISSRLHICLLIFIGSGCN